MALLLYRKLRVYGASKLAHAEMWKQLEWDWPEIALTARWPLVNTGHLDKSQEICKVFWEHDLADIRESDVVLLFAKPGEDLRGALVEAGMGIALGKRVVLVGKNQGYGTWQHHPQVSKVPDLAAARVLLETFAVAER